MYTEEVQYKSAVSESSATKQAATINYLIDNSVDVLGTVIKSTLTLAQFAAQKGFNHTEPLTTRKYTIMDGSSIVGSDLNTLTGQTTLADAVGNQAFFRNTDSDGNIGNFESSQNKSHTHTASDVNVPFAINQDVAGGTTGTPYLAGAAVNTESVTIDPDGGSESRPVNYKMSFFIKINN